MVEMLVVIAIIGILAALLLPTLTQAKAKAKRIQCVSDLQQIGLAFHTFMHDHDSKFPMQVSTNNGGTLEFVRASQLINGEFYFQYRHFQALSNDLRSPQLLACPADQARTPAETFPNLQDNNISYFVGANAEYAKPNSLLAGDRNLTNASAGGQSLIHLDSGVLVNWTGELHQYKGNILFADGRVEELNSAGLQLADLNAPAAVLNVPSVSPPGGASPSYPTPPYSPSPSHYVPPTPRGSGLQPGDDIPLRQLASAPANPNSAGPGPSATPSYRPPITSTPKSLSVEDVSALAVIQTNVPRVASVKPAKIETNPPAEDVTPIIIAQQPAKRSYGTNHWPWWLLLLAVLLSIALRIYMVRRSRAGGRYS